MTPRRSALITADDSQQQLDIGGRAEPDAWMWAPVTDGKQGDWRCGYTSRNAAVAAAQTWLHAQSRTMTGGAS